MRKSAAWIGALALTLLLAGCSGTAAGGSPQPEASAASTVSFVSGMGCSDPNCTDPSHHHDCPADCADYEHHHNCPLDCTDASHHHAAHHSASQHTETPSAAPAAFIAGMGCSDPTCTDPSHHHDCPADCADYEHHHNCPLDCTDASHNHAAHHEEPHHTAAQTESAPPAAAQPASQPEQPKVQIQTLSTVSYISGMGCSDPNCTDPSHYHDCPADCANYDHYHNCALTCAEPGHCHGGAHREELRSAQTPTVMPVAFVSGMGCSDPSCTDPSHHHDCPADCGNYEHHHNCGLDCAEPTHHHGGTHHEEPQPAQTPAVMPVAFVSGMGCSDPACTDPSHYHDCPADCGNYEHHHNCALDCTESTHHHSYMMAAGSSGRHHGSAHHSGHH